MQDRASELPGLSPASGRSLTCNIIQLIESIRILFSDSSGLLGGLLGGYEGEVQASGLSTQMAQATLTAFGLEVGNAPFDVLLLPNLESTVGREDGSLQK